MIIALSGRKGSGKNTIGRFICDWFAARQYDKIWLESKQDRAEFLSDKERDHVRQEFTGEYSFADNLKEFCIDTLGLSEQSCYGSDDDKNAPTKYQWDDAPQFFRWKFGTRAIDYVKLSGTTTEVYRDTNDSEFLRQIYYSQGATPIGHRSGPMTGRDIMQLFGTELIRETFGNVWAKATIRRIRKQGKRFAVITDNRFPNEIEAVLEQPDGYIIRLTRSPFGTQDCHPSEASLDGYDWNRERCFVVDNTNKTVQEQNNAVTLILQNLWNQQTEQ